VRSAPGQNRRVPVNAQDGVRGSERVPRPSSAWAGSAALAQSAEG
jgi:hypothetical protein